MSAPRGVDPVSLVVGVLGAVVAVLTLAGVIVPPALLAALAVLAAGLLGLAAGVRRLRAPAPVEPAALPPRLQPEQPYTPLGF